MLRRLILLSTFALLAAGCGIVRAQEVAIALTHVAKDKWRADYRFAKAVTAVKLDAVGSYRQQAWKVLTPGITLSSDGEHDVLAAGGQPFQSASIEITRFDGVEQKNYAPFIRFTDGGMAVFLGFLQGEGMVTDIRVHGLPGEHVIAPPLNRLDAGGMRGYAYFGPARAVAGDVAAVLLDPATPAWMRETVLDVGAKMARYYEQAYQRKLQDELTIMLAVPDVDGQGFSINGGATLGQLVYRAYGGGIVDDHPKKREMLAKTVAHEMAHIWQSNVARGGIGAPDPWIHEGGAEAMALEGLRQTGIWSEAQVATYRAAKVASCDKLGGSVTSYEGIYACGLVRFDRIGVPIVALWRSMMEATEAKGEVYSVAMLKSLGGKLAAD
jgi:hypothetical protein